MELQEFRISYARDDKIVGFVKSGSSLLACQKVAWALGLDVTKLYAEIVE